jgi:hypothetical protein
MHASVPPVYSFPLGGTIREIAELKINGMPAEMISGPAL